MPVSHTCPSCCNELGHIRAVPDPHYGLGVVVCPRCRHAAVRTRHPDIVFWRHVRRMRKGISQLTLTLILSALTVVTVIGMGRTLRDHLSDRSAHYTFPNLNNPSDSSIFITTLLLVLISGMIARAIYAHLKFLSVLAIFIILIGVTWSLDAIIAQLLMLAVELGKTREYVSSPSSTDMLRRAMMLLVEFPIFIVGMLLGRYLSRSVQRSAPKRIMRIRRKRRKRTRRLD